MYPVISENNFTHIHTHPYVICFQLLKYIKWKIKILLHNHVSKEVTHVRKRSKNKKRATDIPGLTKTGHLMAFQNPSKKGETLGLYLVSHWILLATADQALLDQLVECQPLPGAQS